MITKKSLADSINAAEVINTTSIDLEAAKVINSYIRASLIDVTVIAHGTPNVKLLNKLAELKVSTALGDPDRDYTIEEAETELLSWLAGSLVQDSINLFGETLQLLVDDHDFNAINRAAIAERIEDKYLGRGGKIHTEVNKLEILDKNMHAERGPGDGWYGDVLNK